MQVYPQGDTLGGECQTVTVPGTAYPYADPWPAWSNCLATFSWTPTPEPLVVKLKGGREVELRGSYSIKKLRELLDAIDGTTDAVILKDGQQVVVKDGGQ